MSPLCQAAVCIVDIVHSKIETKKKEKKEEMAFQTKKKKETEI